ncbi:heat shock protein Hsp20 [bacterium A37T11]|nr:heat shock protein Hsp20 [bacterium A37T11]
MSLVKFKNGNNTPNLSSGFNDIFESFFNDSFFSDRMVSRVPAVNVSETADDYNIEMAAPGLEKGDFKINLDRNLLTVSVEQQKQQESHDKQYTKREYSYNSFVRSFALPDSADDAQIEASYKDGILHIKVAKKEEAKHQVRQIDIR